MPFLTIVLPVFNSIAIEIGPIAIRWYALAYIGGIVIGWIYARSLLKNEKLWGGPATLTPVQLDPFLLCVAHPSEILELWKGGMSFHGGFLGCVAAVMLFSRKNNTSILSLGDITTAVGPIGLFLWRIAKFIHGEF